MDGETVDTLPRLIYKDIPAVIQESVILISDTMNQKISNKKLLKTAHLPAESLRTILESRVSQAPPQKKQVP